jgi:tetratricopeptide (TPR) repeat protein
MRARWPLAHLASTAFVLTSVLAGCASTPTTAPTAATDEAPKVVDSAASNQAAFEQKQRERAINFARQKRLGDAALTWEVLVVLRPDVAEYRERWAEAQRQIDAAVAERMPRGAQAMQRGDLDGAAQQYLAVLALQPQNDQAADAMRGVERERNKRNYLGKFSRVTLTRRAMADAEMPVDASRMASRNEIEYASLLANDGEYDDAIGLLEKRLATDKRDTAAKRLLASVYSRKADSMLPADKPGAIAAFERSVKLDPTDSVVVGKLRRLKGGASAAKTTAATTASSAVVNVSAPTNAASGVTTTTTTTSAKPKPAL